MHGLINVNLKIGARRGLSQGGGGGALFITVQMLSSHHHTLDKM